MILVQANSAGFEGGNFAKITVNDVPIFIEENETKNTRGLHIVVINP